MKSDNVQSGARILHDALVHEGVTVLFGYPGSDMLPFYDELYHSSTIRHILVRHEQAAAHAADGYARSSGVPGVCMATSGPGSTNLITGIAAAYADSIPLVALTFNASSEYLGKGVFQEVDMISITNTITKKNWRIRSVEEIPAIIHQAFYESQKYPQGPVLIDIPSDIIRKNALGNVELETMNDQGGRQSLSDVERAAFFSLLSQAKRPVFIAGSGIVQSQSHVMFRNLVERLNVPVASTVSGVGSISEHHPLALEVLGVLGTPYANSALQKADCIVAWGMHFEPRSTARLEYFAPNAKIIQIDINHKACGLFVQPTLCLSGDVSAIISAMLDDERSRAYRAPTEWIEQIALWNHSCALRSDAAPSGIQPSFIMETLERIVPNIRIFAGNGLHKYWALRHFTYTYPRQFNTNSRFGAMGFALPGAIGASIALDEPIVVVTGDGSIQMNIQELATLADLSTPVKILVFNNGSLGAIRQHQHFSYGKRFIGSTFDKPLAIAEIAQSYGIRSETVGTHEYIQPALERALHHPGPYLINFVLHPDTYLEKKISINESLDALICPVEPIIDTRHDLA